MLIFEGNKAAAKILNDSIRVLGSDIPASKIIDKICKDFNLETKEMKKQRQWPEDMKEEMRLREKYSLGQGLSMAEIKFLKNRGLICIDLSNLTNKSFQIIVQCVGSRTGGMPTVDQSDMRGLVTA